MTCSATVIEHEEDDGSARVNFVRAPGIVIGGLAGEKESREPTRWSIIGLAHCTHDAETGHSEDGKGEEQRGGAWREDVVGEVPLVDENLSKGCVASGL